MHVLLHQIARIIIACNRAADLTAIRGDILVCDASHAQLLLLTATLKKLVEALHQCQLKLSYRTENLFRDLVTKKTFNDFSSKEEAWMDNYTNLLPITKTLLDTIERCSRYCDFVKQDAVTVTSSDCLPSDESRNFIEVAAALNNDVDHFFSRTRTTPLLSVWTTPTSAKEQFVDDYHSHELSEAGHMIKRGEAEYNDMP